MPTLVIGTTQCPYYIIPTTQASIPPQPTLIETLQPTPVTNSDKATDSVLDQSGTEDTPLNHGSDPRFNTGLIVAITVSALMVVIIVILTAVLCFVIIYILCV